MWVDEIVEETRKARAEYAAGFEYDIAAIVADAKANEKHSERRIVSRPPKPACAGSKGQATIVIGRSRDSTWQVVEATIREDINLSGS